MFHNALFAKPQELSMEQLTIGLEKSFAELESATTTLDRLCLAREAFAQIPAEHINSKTVSLFASSFADVAPKFIPETSTKSLESAFGETGPQMRVFALESGDGVIDKIIGFIKYIITQIKTFITNVYKKIKGGKWSDSYSSTGNIDLGKVFNATIKPTEDFAVFVVKGKLTVDSLNKVSQEMTKISNDLLTKCKLVNQAASTFDYKPEVVERVFGVDKELLLIPETDYPGRAYFVVNNNMEATIETEKGQKPSKMDELMISRMSLLDGFVKNIENTKDSLLKAITELDKSMDKLNKEADTLAKSRQSMATAKTSEFNDITDVEVKSEVEASPLAMKMFVKIVGTLTNGITRVSVRFLEHERNAFESLVAQAKK